MQTDILQSAVGRVFPDNYCVRSRPNDLAIFHALDRLEGYHVFKQWFYHNYLMSNSVEYEHFINNRETG